MPGATRATTVRVATVTTAATTAATSAVRRPDLGVMLAISGGGVKSVGGRHFESENIVRLEPVRRSVHEPGLGALGLLLGKLELPFIEIRLSRCKLGLSQELLLGARRLSQVGL